MATSSQAKALLGGLAAEIKKAVGDAFDYILHNSLAFGPIDHSETRTKTTNFYGRYLKLTTSAVANQEFTVAHGLGRTPNMVLPVLSPRVVNARLLGDLLVSRAADENRLYFTSASTSVTTWVYCE